MIKAELSVYVCDFCAKTQFEAKHIVSGLNGAAICDSCIPAADEKLREMTGHAKLFRPSALREYAACLKDAERYRALRAVPISEMSHVRVLVTFEGGEKPHVATAEVVDAAADLLLAKQREKTNGL